jgi:hypothetical protein
MSVSFLRAIPRVIESSNEETTTIRYGVQPLASKRRTRHCGPRWLSSATIFLVNTLSSTPSSRGEKISSADER